MTNSEAFTRLRNQFNELDKNLLVLLAARVQLSKKIARLKKQNNLAIEQPDVWKDRFDSRLKESEELQIDKTYLKNVFDLIHQESIRIQKQEIEK